MADLDVPCFRYRGQELTARLAVETGEETTVTCPVRGGVYLLTPEERVRQALIWFLVCGSERSDPWDQDMQIAVEQRSLDISGFYAGEGIARDFAPIVPVLMIETKRPEVDVLAGTGAEDQLVTYMRREQCRSGMTFNARQAAWITLTGDLSQPTCVTEILTDLQDVEERIDIVIAGASAHVNASAADFRAANVGDFAALARLVELFGDDPRLTFALSVRSGGCLDSIQAFNLSRKGQDGISYRARSIVTRNRLQFTRPDFHALLAIRPL